MARPDLLELLEGGFLPSGEELPPLLPIQQVLLGLRLLELGVQKKLLLLPFELRQVPLGRRYGGKEEAA